MDTIEKDKLPIEKVSIIGLGYVGLPIGVAFAEKGIKVIAFDINSEKIKSYQNGYDPTNEVGSERLKKVKIKFTTSEVELKASKFHIIAVPTPVDKNNEPDLSNLISACKIVGRNLSKDSIIVFESTVYPGTTEEICVPILEEESGLSFIKDFNVGYSPERINPGDKIHTLKKITKIISGSNEKSLNKIREVYKVVIEAELYIVSSIKVAEAAKVIENSQRDINIAFMNEIAQIFHQIGIDTKEVLEAANTKWNFLDFVPGLVGGHCIGVDPYYLIHKAKKLNCEPKLLIASRQINDSMGEYIAKQTIRLLKENNIPVENSRVLVLGLTFKEDVPDLRNSKVLDIVNKLREYGVRLSLSDPIADKNEVKAMYNEELIESSELSKLNKIDAIIACVAHNEYRTLNIDELHINSNASILIDVKGIFDKEEIKEKLIYWQL